MKIVFFDDNRLGLQRDDGVVDVSGDVTAGVDAQATLVGLIEHFEQLRPTLQRRLADGSARPLEEASLGAPVPWPTKILCMAGNYREGTDMPIRPIRGFLSPPDAVLAPGGTTVLPSHEIRVCQHEAELVAVIGKSARNVSEADALQHVFGYTAGVDVSPRNKEWGFLGKSCDGFKPIGPCITTADEIGDPHNLQVRLSVQGEARQDYNTRDIAHPVAECVSWFSSLMTLNPGDLLFMGTNHQQLGSLQDGDTATMEIDKIGRFSFSISDPLKRSWPRGIDDYAANHAREMLAANAAALAAKQTTVG